MNQLSKPIGNYVERIIRDKNGQLVRATFCVYECSGHIKARLVSAEYIKEDIIENSSTPVLAGFVERNTQNFIEYVGETISPYFNLNTLYFSGSKPRAPTQKQ
ncbi:MAG: hypothetical protein QG579_281 [Patescibacteria group bacterium]|jgi:hypothetical protein|nr:hypothetical protein [Patescibacteria group bacterium]